MENEAEKWETGGSYRQGVDAITNAVGLALGGSPTAGVVTGAISPYVNTQIKQVTESNEQANLIAHAIWGAVEAYTQGGKAGAGAVAAVTGEVGASIISQKIFGKKPENLTEAEKRTVSELSQVAAGLASGLSSSGGNSLSIAQATSSGQGIGKNAVENNAFLDSQVSDLFKDLEKAEKEGGSLEEVFLKYKELSDKQLQDIQENCQSAWCRYGAEKYNEEANQKALELVGFFNSLLSTLSNSTQERFIEFVIAENAKEMDFIDGARTPLEKTVVFLVNNFIEDRENKGIKISPQIASFAKKTTLAKPIEYLSKPKQKVNSSSIGDIVRTPTTHAEDFERKRDSKGNAVYVNKHTGEIWSKSNTRHSDKAGEWKVGLNGKEPTASKKITIGDSDGKIIKKDDK